METIIKELLSIDKITFNLDYFFVATIFSILSSFSVIILDLIFKKYKLKFLSIDLKGIDYVWWIVGSLLTYQLLYLLKIVPFNIQSIIIVSFIWTKLIMDNYKSLLKKELKKEEELLLEYEELL